MTGSFIAHCQAIRLALFIEKEQISLLVWYMLPFLECLHNRTKCFKIQVGVPSGSRRTKRMLCFAWRQISHPCVALDVESNQPEVVVLIQVKQQSTSILLCLSLDSASSSGSTLSERRRCNSDASATHLASVVLVFESPCSRAAPFRIFALPRVDCVRFTRQLDDRRRFQK